MSKVYLRYKYLLEKDILEPVEKEYFNNIVNKKVTPIDFVDSINQLSNYLKKYTKKSVYIFLDEYDTPLQAAYSSGYWDKITKFMSMLFENTFKENKALNRAVLTGITRVAKESIFSGLNNLRVITITSETYASCFGFTEEETFKALDMYDLSEKKDAVKKYYDGFIMGGKIEIYNPWSVINFLTEKKFGTYWINTSSNTLIGASIRQANSEIKNQMQELLKGNSIKVDINEEIVFKELDYDPEAIWSLMLASGYLKVLNANEVDNIEDSKKEDKYMLAITNQETRKGLENLVKGWFKKSQVQYNNFIKAMLKGNSDDMEDTLNALSISMFSSFDVGKKPSELEPERFYHGFVLGLLVDLKDKYSVDSNRESGYGRYDIMIKPIDKKGVGVIIEFKVFSPRKEKDLNDTVSNALAQIEEKNYEKKLQDEGIDTIYKYGIAFCGKECKIGMADCS